MPKTVTEAGLPDAKKAKKYCYDQVQIRNNSDLEIALFR